MKGQTTVFQDTAGGVYIIKDTIELCDGNVILPGHDVLTLVDADGRHREPEPALLSVHNLRMVVASSPRTRTDRRWLKQYCPYTGLILVMEPWTKEELFLSAYVHPRAEHLHLLILE